MANNAWTKNGPLRGQQPAQSNAIIANTGTSITSVPGGASSFSAHEVRKMLEQGIFYVPLNFARYVKEFPLGYNNLSSENREGDSSTTARNSSAATKGETVARV